MKYEHIKAVILDWAGTTVDFGSLAPVAALQCVFESKGVPITVGEAREHMGTLKKDQIRSICAGDRVADAWREKYGGKPSENDVEAIFSAFLPQQNAILAHFSAPIVHVPETAEKWRNGGLKLGSTTGYTRALLDVVIRGAAELGYAPDCSVTPDEVGGGRPKPFMCYRNAILLGVYPLANCVKIGDTPADVAEGLNAGMWTIGITVTGNEVGLSQSEWDALSEAQKSEKESHAARKLTSAGAHFTAQSLADCTPILGEIERRIAAGVRP